MVMVSLSFHYLLNLFVADGSSHNALVVWFIFESNGYKQIAQMSNIQVSNRLINHKLNVDTTSDNVAYTIYFLFMLHFLHSII